METRLAAALCKEDGRHGAFQTCCRGLSLLLGVNGAGWSCGRSLYAQELHIE